MADSTNLKWFPTNAPIASSRTDDIWFIDPMRGWAVNSNGQILKTIDGGNSWTQQFQDDIYLRCIGFANDSKGWAGTLTAGKRFYSTTDGGQNWYLIDNMLPELAPSAICGLSVVSESVVYGSGTNYPDRPPRMVKTIDGGATWTAWEMSEYATLLIDNYFIDENRGWVVGGKADPSIPKPSRDNVIPVVLYTEDGGKTWVNRVADISSSFPLGEWGWKIEFLNDRVGFVSLENFSQGAILKTTDGGQTWTRLRINDPQENANLEGIGFIDENKGWVGGWGDANFEGGFSSLTEDGGLNWQDANEIGQFINRFRFFGNPVTVGYASGLTVYKYSSEPIMTPLLERVPPLRFLTTNTPAVFDKSVKIDYMVPENSKKVRIDIWNQFGGYVRQLVSEDNPTSGQKSAIWDGKDDAGGQLPSGIFIYRLTVDGNAESRVIRLKH